MAQSDNALHWQVLSPAKPQNSKTLLIGNSIIRDVDENKLLNTKCICIPRGNVSDVKEAVTKFSTANKMRRIVLVVSGNDCEGGKNSSLTPTTNVLSKYEELIKCATEVSSFVIVSNLCPRSSGHTLRERIHVLNAGLKMACDDLGAEFVDNDPSFHLQDGTLNDGCFGQIRATPDAGRAHNHDPQTIPTPIRTNPREFQNHRNFYMSPQLTTLNLSFANFATEQAILLSPAVAGNPNALDVTKRVTLPEHVPNRDRGQAVWHLTIMFCRIPTRPTSTALEILYMVL